MTTPCHIHAHAVGKVTFLNVKNVTLDFPILMAKRLQINQLHTAFRSGFRGEQTRRTPPTLPKKGESTRRVCRTPSRKEILK